MELIMIIGKSVFNIINPGWEQLWEGYLMLCLSEKHDMMRTHLTVKVKMYYFSAIV